MAASSQRILPTIDLGYEVHRAFSFDHVHKIYNFSNIRYAQSPTGRLRFSRPVLPVNRNPDIQDGTVGRICPQATAEWLSVATSITPYFVAGTESSFNFTDAQRKTNPLHQQAEQDPRTTEDCLFLDVVVPEAVFNRRFDKPGNLRNGFAGGPVVVWIHGGGYVFGHKGLWDNPGLVEASQVKSEGIIFVSINYRLGALGWLAGLTLQDSGGVSNVGLYDQRLALEWVQTYIHLFGGDPAQVTVMGMSAGAGSIIHQITAFGGMEPVPFQRAISQSPVFSSTTSLVAQENTTKAFLGLLNVSTIDEARNLDTATVIRANQLQIGASHYGTVIFGPAVDGIFVPASPINLLAEGKFATNIDVMTSNAKTEGLWFTPPYVQTDSQMEALIQTNYPHLNRSMANHMIESLYPARYDGSQLYHNEIQRTMLYVTETQFTCIQSYLSRAFKNKTFAYRFSVPPSLHGFDLGYTFYTEKSSLPGKIAVPVARIIQDFLTQFVMNGNPNVPSLPSFPFEGDGTALLSIGLDKVETQHDSTHSQRCDWLRNYMSP